jgi:hypothetical protein
MADTIRGAISSRPKMMLKDVESIRKGSHDFRAKRKQKRTQVVGFVTMPTTAEQRAAMGSIFK